MDINLSNIPKTTIIEERDIFRLDHDDWYGEYLKDKASGKVIMISDPKVIRDGMKSNGDSIFNSEFNVPTDIDEKIIEYSCDCDKVYGRYNEGQICPECNTVVQVRYSIELLRRGWIDLCDYKIIVPAMYNKIRAFVGRKKLDEIINIDTNVPIKPDSSNPFKGLGIVEFETRYIEILNYFRNYTNKPELYQILLDRKDITFSNKIYMMSSAHRPGFVSSKNKSFQYHDVNVLFVNILTDFRLVLKGYRTGRKAVECIGNIQAYLMQIHDLTMGKLLGKERIVRSSIISGRLWYSSRMVIVSETETDDIDSVRMSYKGFIGMFELEIMNAMLHGYGDPMFARMSTAECRIYLTKCKFSNEIDDRIYAICQALIKKRKDDGLYVIVDRNPSFDLGSIQTFRIFDIFPDARKHVLTIPHNSLVEFNGDYDGDVLNVYSPKEKCVIDAFKEGFMPSKLILDRAGGYFNGNMTPIKDELAFIRSFCDSGFIPVDPESVKLRSLADILSDIEDPFDYKKLEKSRELFLFQDLISSGGFYRHDENVYGGIDQASLKVTEHTSDEEFIKIPFSYDTLSSDKLCQDPFDILDKDEFLPCVVASIG